MGTCGKPITGLAIGGLLALGLLVMPPASAQTLVLSDQVAVDIGDWPMVVPTGTTLILRRGDDYVSYEEFDARRVYPEFDLEGRERQFIRAIFFPEERERLPGRIAELARDQAAAFGIAGEPVRKRVVGGAHVVGAYANRELGGEIFILEGKRVHRLQVRDARAVFDAAFKGIARHSDESG